MTAPAIAIAGTLYLVPNTLDFGIDADVPDLQDVLPLAVIQTAARLTHWVAESARTTRAFLKRVDAVAPLAQSLQSLAIDELPRPMKGTRGAAPVDLRALLQPALQGRDIGLISEAGLPAVADPGTALVATAHTLGIKVVALAGASSILLALAVSGLNGQSFAFVGYVPVDASERAARIRELEALSRRHGQTQLMIETPYRNPALLGALLAQLQESTRVSVSCGLTLRCGFNRTDSVRAWRGKPTLLPSDIPAVFSLLAE